MKVCGFYDGRPLAVLGALLHHLFGKSKLPFCEQPYGEAYAVGN